MDKNKNVQWNIVVFVHEMLLPGQMHTIDVEKCHPLPAMHLSFISGKLHPGVFLV